MAIDTQAKRESIPILPFLWSILPKPDGEFDSFDRAHLLWVYGWTIVAIANINLTITRTTPARTFTSSTPERTFMSVTPVRTIHGG